MTGFVDKIIQIADVRPGKFGGAFVTGRAIGEYANLKCKIDWRVTIHTPRVGEFWQMVGNFYNDEKYGWQLRVTSCRPVKLPGERYLASLLARHPEFRGFHFGQKKVGDLIASFGEATLVKYLNNGNVHALSSVVEAGIAVKLVRAWHRVSNEVDTVNFLLEHRFTPELARKVIHLCRDNTIKRLKSNPYALICFGDISRSIWRTVEICAKKLSFSLDDENRLVGAVEHILYEHLRRGHTAMPLEQVMEGAEKLLGTRKRADKGVRSALKRRAICVLNSRSGPLVQLYGPALIEQQLEKRIECLLSGPKQLGLFEDCEAQLQKLIHDYCDRESTNGIRFTVKQMEAIFMALSNKLSILTGFGGTGKTTILRAIVDLAKIMRREVHLLALAGKAKERARLATGHRAFTIHAFIAAVKKGAKDINIDDNPLIIIDEASMVDTILFNELLGLMDGKSFSLLTVGDTSQISPVGFGLVWHRLAMMPEIQTVHLTEVHRQQSVLQNIAMAVRMFGGNGDDIKIPEWRGESEGVFHVPADKNNLRQKLLLLKWIESQKGFLPAQILTPHMAEHMPDSGSKINRYIQKELTGDKDGIRLGMHWLRVGDPVIVSENNYDLGLFNGTTGKLLRVDTSGDALTGVFSLEGHDEEILLTTDDLFDVAMKPAYAISIHKSQGSEYDTTIITSVVDSPMIERSMIYTALTRAKKLCLIVGSLEVFVDAISKPSRAETLSVGFFMSKLTR